MTGIAVAALLDKGLGIELPVWLYIVGVAYLMGLGLEDIGKYIGK